MYVYIVISISIFLSIYLYIYIDLLPVADLIPQWKLTCKLCGPGQHVASSLGGPSVE